MRHPYVRCHWIGLASVCLVLMGGFGCGSSEPEPNLAEVTGVVTLDGVPLSGATVSFVPKTPDAQGNGRASSGTTDEKGAFVLLYGPGQEGAIVGEHIVQISKLEGTSDEPGEELLPARYHMNSELTATVSDTNPNHFEFPLDSGKKK